MAYIPRSSLIPNEASGVIPVQMKKRRTIHAFGLIATILFILSLIGAVSVFLYKDYLNKELIKAKAALTATGSDDGKQIEEVRVYDDRLRIANGLLDNHIAPSRIFEEIENSTKKTVQYDSLEFTYDPGFEATLVLSGKTKEFSSVALQKMQIFKDDLFSDFVLQNITNAQGGKDEKSGTITEDGVTFQVTGIFKKDLIGYRNMIQEGKTETKVEESPASEPVSVPDPINDEPNTDTVVPPVNEVTP